jgi:hypothetical protein
MRPAYPAQRYWLCRRRIFMVNLSHGREIQGSLGVRSLLLSSLLRLVRLNGLSVYPSLSVVVVQGDGRLKSNGRIYTFR